MLLARGSGLTGPGGVPRRGKVRPVPRAIRCPVPPRSSRGEAQAGGGFLARRAPVQTVSGAVVHESPELPHLQSVDLGKRGPLWILAADQPVDVLVRAPFPGMVGVGEEDVHLQPLGDGLVPGELLAVVKRQAEAGAGRQLREQAKDGAGHLLGFLGLGPPDQGEAGLAFHQRDQMSGARSPVDQVALPMSEHLARRRFGRTLVDPALVAQAALPAAVVAGAAPPALPVRPRQATPKRAARFAFGVQMLVDRLLADEGPPLFAGLRGNDLRRRPFVPEAPGHFRLHLRREAPTHHPLRPGLGPGVRLPIAVAPLAPVAPQLPADRAARPAQPPGDRPDPVAFLTHEVDQPTLFLGHAMIHAGLLVLAYEDPILSRDPLLR